MSTVVIDETVRIPNWVKDHSSFRRWARSEEFPERGWVSFINGEVWVDMSPEELFTHNQVKGEYAIVLGGLMRGTGRGRYCPDRMLLTNLSAGLSTEPDGMFVSTESLQKKRVQLVRGRRGYIEMRGTPDMVLEVVSDSSPQKDLEVMPELYWRAGIQEFWLVDVRGEEFKFDILRHTNKGYVAARKQSGWMKSEVFGKSFKLTVQKDELGYPEYTLLVR